jgi:hypothetical protein
MHRSERSAQWLKNLLFCFAFSIETNQPAESSPEPGGADWALRLSLVGLLLVVPVELIASAFLIYNSGFFGQVMVLLLIFFVFSFAGAVPVATLMLRFAPRHRVAWGIILVASSSILGFLSLFFGFIAPAGSDAAIVTYVSIPMDVGCLFTLIGGIIAITKTKAHTTVHL